MRERYVMNIEFGSIYVIWCLITNKKYVGQTDQKEPWNRIFAHRSKSETSTMNNKFWNAIRKYGPENFVGYFLHENNVHVDDLDDMEVHYIFDMDTERNGYNSTPGGDFSPFRDPKIKQKAEENQRKTVASKEWKEANTGDNHWINRDPIRKQKFCEDRTGEKNPFYNQKHSDEIRAIMSQKQQEMVNDPDYVNGMQGKKHTKDSRDKMSFSQKRRFAREKIEKEESAGQSFLFDMGIDHDQ